jgi:Zn-dependent protease with chaperone function
MEYITEEKFNRTKYPKEDICFKWAMIIGIPMAILSLVILGSFTFILIYVVSLILLYWIVLLVSKMELVGNAVRVSESNFPEIFDIYNEVRQSLSYKKEIQIYVIEGGTVNAFLTKFFRVEYIILNSELVKDMIDNDFKRTQLKWFIARFIGSIKAKHFRLEILRLTLEYAEKLKVLNVFLLPYERATQYTGDNMGMLVTKDVEQSIIAFNKLMVGNDLASKIRFEGIIEQGKDLKRSYLFSFIARAFSSHPHLVSRYLNLLAYARKEFPEQFEAYVAAFDNETKYTLFRVLPDYD